MAQREAASPTRGDAAHLNDDQSRTALTAPKRMNFDDWPEGWSVIGSDALPLQVASIGPDPVTVAEEAVRWLLFRKQWGASAADLRAAVRPGTKASSRRKALEALVEELEDGEAQLPWPQLREEFAGGDLERCDTWDHQFHPNVLRGIVLEYLKLMDCLHAKLPGTRSPEVPERMFVEELAVYWTKELRLKIANGRSGADKQQGQFAQFVREVIALYRDQLEVLRTGNIDTKHLELGSLDGHIRKVAELYRHFPA